MASSLITGGTSFTVATLVPVVQWGLNGFPHPVPESVPYLIAAGLLTLGHAIFNYYQAFITSQAEKAKASVSQPSAQPSAPADTTAQSTLVQMPAQVSVQAPAQVPAQQEQTQAGQVQTAPRSNI